MLTINYFFRTLTSQNYAIHVIDLLLCCLGVMLLLIRRILPYLGLANVFLVVFEWALHNVAMKKKKKLEKNCNDLDDDMKPPFNKIH